jgi:hypothetical protein
MTITVTGLTHLQKELADQIWQCDSQEDVEAFISGLPQRLRAQARVVHELMIAAVFDQHMEIEDSVQDLISRCSR